MFTCDDCGTKGDRQWMLSHNCAHNQYVNDNGGRCEDYPCCGHTDGDGCAARPEHTKEYWLDRMTSDGYDDSYMDMVDF